MLVFKTRIQCLTSVTDAKAEPIVYTLMEHIRKATEQIVKDIGDANGIQLDVTLET